MPVIRINARDTQPVLHSGDPNWARSLGRIDPGTGPVIVMIHGFKYQPGHRRHCPHHTIFDLPMVAAPRSAQTWPQQLGFGTGQPNEGLAIAFGWPARGALWRARRQANSAGRALAQVLTAVKQRAPNRRIHIIAHSLGVELALAALHILPPNTVGRMISLTGATYQSHVCAALASPAGRTVEFINVTSRENDPFDWMFERLIAPQTRGDQTIGTGLDAPNAVTVQLDCSVTLDHLARIGVQINPAQRRMSHWSSYTRPGAMCLYDRLLRHPEQLPLSLLAAGLPDQSDPRWSRLFPVPNVSLRTSANGPHMAHSSNPTKQLHP